MASLECNYQTLECKFEGDRAMIFLNRPEAGNALNAMMIQELTELLLRLEDNKSTRLIQINAHGKHFCLGADISWLQDFAHHDNKKNRVETENLAKLMHTLYQCHKPVIGVVQGSVYGGGLGLVAGCDIVIASNNAQFCFSEVKLGLVPAVISPFVVQAVGVRVARYYMLTAEVFNAPTALQLHLVHRVTEEAALMQVADDYYAKLHQHGPIALQKVKSLLREISQNASPEKQFEFTVEMISQLRETPEAQEGMRAFLEKRPPKW